MDRKTTLKDWKEFDFFTISSDLFTPSKRGANSVHYTRSRIPRSPDAPALTRIHIHTESGNPGGLAGDVCNGPSSCL